MLSLLGGIGLFSSEFRLPELDSEVGLLRKGYMKAVAVIPIVPL